LKSNNVFTGILIIGIFIGAGLGIIMGPEAVVFKPIGQVFINLLFTLVVPLVFFSIAGAISSSSDMRRLGKLLGSTLGIFITTGIFASVMTIILIQCINPCAGMTMPDLAVNVTPTMDQAVSSTLGMDVVNMLTVSDFSQLLSKEHMLPLIIFTIFFGMCVPKIGEKGQCISDGLNAIAEVIYKMIALLMKFAPIGLGAYFANLTGVFGAQLLGSFASVLAFFYPTALAYFLIFFPIYCFVAGGTRCVVVFFKYAVIPAVTAFGTSSSNAALPAQHEFCDKVGVPPDVSGVVLPMGATMHMDGGCIATVTKIYLVCLLFNVPWDNLEIYIITIFLAVTAATAISAVPGGGAIGSVMMVSVLGLPPEALGVLILIGTLADPMGTMINSTGDSVASFMVTRILEGKNWMTRNLSGKQIL
jgi:Na+/H+-dicarboxylate symporter